MCDCRVQRSRRVDSDRRTVAVEGHSSRRFDDLVAILGEEWRRLEARVLALEAELAHRDGEKAQLEARVAELARENLRIARVAGDVEIQSAELTGLWVVCYRLFESLRREDTLQVIEEVVSAMLGCERFVVYEVDRRRPLLNAARIVGVDPRVWQEVPLGQGTIGATAASGALWLRGRDPAPALPAESGLSAVVPLFVEGQLAGAIALFELLPQKRGFADGDLKLIDMLSRQAATALHCATLDEQRARSVPS